VIFQGVMFQKYLGISGDTLLNYLNNCKHVDELSIMSPVTFPQKLYHLQMELTSVKSYDKEGTG